MTTKLIFLSEIDLDASPKVRAANNPEVIQQYAENYSQKAEMPPIQLFWEKGRNKMYLADGYHRCAALISIGRKAVHSNVHEGGFEAALSFALSANAHHGLPRTNADKRRCAIAAISQWPKLSDAQLGKLACLDDKTIASVRKVLESESKVEPAPTRTSSDGREMPATAPRNSEVPPTEAQPAPAAKLVDSLGTEIPKKVQVYWNRAPEVRELLMGLSNVVGHLKKSQKEEDAMYAEVNFSSTIGDIEKAWFALKCAVPYAICTSCQGHPETQKGGCRMCFGRGLISKFRWDRLVPEEIKKLKAAK